MESLKKSVGMFVVYARAGMCMYKNKDFEKQYLSSGVLFKQDS